MENRPNIYGRVMVGVVLFNLGSFLGQFIADTDDKVRDVQRYNADVAEQIVDVEGISGVNDLILTPDDREFAFNSTGENGQPEQCEGKYEVNDNHAEVVGAIACTQTTEVPDKGER